MLKWIGFLYVLNGVSRSTLRFAGAVKRKHIKMVDTVVVFDM